jgi:hypothetical protein
MVELLFSHHVFAGFSEPDVPVVFFHPDLNSLAEH